MPTDGNYSFCVLIAGLPVPEYNHEGKVYIESNLWTPVSYQQRVSEMVYGELEEQQWPVTPYQVKVQTQPYCPQCWYEVHVDGTRVGRRVLKGGETWVLEGFRDSDGDREFLFSLPRFARDEGDRVDAGRQAKVGTIEITRSSVTFMKKEYRSCEDTEFSQANKKDAASITVGKHTMSTTKKGKILRHRARQGGMVGIWHVGSELGCLSVEYHMAHSLQDMGITLRQVEWDQSLTYPTSSVPTSSASSSTEGRPRRLQRKRKACDSGVKTEID